MWERHHLGWIRLQRRRGLSNRNRFLLLIYKYSDSFSVNCPLEQSLDIFNHLHNRKRLHLNILSLIVFHSEIISEITDNIICQDALLVNIFHEPFWYTINPFVCISSKGIRNNAPSPSSSWASPLISSPDVTALRF